MAIAFNSAVDGGNNGGANASLTFAFNNVAGDIMFIGILGDLQTGADDILTVTYNSVTCSFVAKRISLQYPTSRNLYLYVLPAPATGNHNVVITFNTTHYVCWYSCVLFRRIEYWPAGCFEHGGYRCGRDNAGHWRGFNSR